MKPKTRPTLLQALLLLVLLIGLPVWLTWREVRQERQNRDLIAAIKQNDTATAISLLNAGADANTTDRGSTSVSARQVLQAWLDRLRGRKPATSAFHPSALIVAEQGEIDAAQDGPPKYSFYPIFQGLGIPVIPDDNLALYQALLDHGADPNAKDEDGDTALILATQSDHVARARLLLDHGADVNARGQGARTALMYAYSDRPTGMIELLLERGALVNVSDKDGQTALMYACQYKCYRQGLERLLAAGAEVNARDKDGFTALIYVSGNKDCVRLLKQHGAKQ